MFRFWISAVCVVAAMLPLTPAAAQVLPALDVRVGLSAGPNALPESLRSYTRYPEPQRGLVGGMNVGARAVLGLPGPLSIEARAHMHSGADLNQNWPDGGGGHDPVPADDRFPIHLPSPTAPWHRPLTKVSSSYSAYDARLRADFGQVNQQVLSMGYGALRDGPVYLTGSIGYRRAGAVRWGVDLDLVGYRMPWRTTTAILFADPEDPSRVLIGSFEDTDFRFWQLGVGLGAVIELAIP